MLYSALSLAISLSSLIALHVSFFSLLLAGGTLNISITSPNKKFTHHPSFSSFPLLIHSSLSDVIVFHLPLPLSLSFFLSDSFLCPVIFNHCIDSTSIILLLLLDCGYSHHSVHGLCRLVSSHKNTRGYHESAVPRSRLALVSPVNASNARPTFLLNCLFRSVTKSTSPLPPRRREYSPRRAILCVVVFVAIVPYVAVSVIFHSFKQNQPSQIKQEQQRTSLQALLSSSPLSPPCLSSSVVAGCSHFQTSLLPTLPAAPNTPSSHPPLLPAHSSPSSLVSCMPCADTLRPMLCLFVKCHHHSVTHSLVPHCGQHITSHKKREKERLRT